MHLAPFVHHFWWVRWALRSPFTTHTLPHPSVQILQTTKGGKGGAIVLGIHTGRLSRRLSGKGETFGIAFRPAMFHALLGASVATVTDRVVPLSRVLGPRANEWSHALGHARAMEGKIAITESFLGSLLSAPPPSLTRLRDVVERMAADRSILRVEDVSTAMGLDIRAVQRAFRVYVGVSPKWVIQRYRLHEAAMQLTSAAPPTLAALAATLGYADQAHFGRDFKRTIGETPRSFAHASGLAPMRR